MAKKIWDNVPEEPTTTIDPSASNMLDVTLGSAPQPVVATEEVIAPKVEEVVSEEVVEEEQEVAEVVDDTDRQSRNFKEMRIDRARLERELAETRAQLAQRQQPAAQQPAAQQPANQQDSDNNTYEDDDLIEGKQLKREVAAIKKQLQQAEYARKIQNDEARLNSRYSDFGSVVNADTIAVLRDEDPDFAESVAMSSASLYSRGASTYKRIKELGLYVEPSVKVDIKRTQKNIAKPRSVNSIAPQHGDSPLSQANLFANGLTEDVKEILRQKVAAAKSKY